MSPKREDCKVTAKHDQQTYSRTPFGPQRPPDCDLILVPRLPGIPTLVFRVIAAFAPLAHGAEGEAVAPTAPAEQTGAPETGIASWYGDPYHGRRAANGEIYDMENLTGRYRTLPFAKRVRVRNLGNDRSVEVRINDRGPFAEGRIIDLSRAAARAIGLVRPAIRQSGLR